MRSPLCVVVLSMLEHQPLLAHEVARELESRGLTEAGTGFPCALATLERLSGANLIRRRRPYGPDGRIALTHRGLSELRLQRMLWRRVRFSNG